VGSVVEAKAHDVLAWLRYRGATNHVVPGDGHVAFNPEAASGANGIPVLGEERGDVTGPAVYRGQPQLVPERNAPAGLVAVITTDQAHERLLA
jgi:hypothetical protein